MSDAIPTIYGFLDSELRKKNISGLAVDIACHIITGMDVPSAAFATDRCIELFAKGHGALLNSLQCLVEYSGNSLTEEIEKDDYLYGDSLRDRILHDLPGALMYRNSNFLRAFDPNIGEIVTDWDADYKSPKALEILALRSFVQSPGAAASQDASNGPTSAQNDAVGTNAPASCENAATAPETALLGIPATSPVTRKLRGIDPDLLAGLGRWRGLQVSADADNFSGCSGFHAGVKSRAALLSDEQESLSAERKVLEVFPERYTTIEDLSAVYKYFDTSRPIGDEDVYGVF